MVSGRVMLSHVTRENGLCRDFQIGLDERRWLSSSVAKLSISFFTISTRELMNDGREPKTK